MLRFITDSYGLVFVGRPRWREDGFVFCISCWPLPGQSFSGPSPICGSRPDIFINVTVHYWQLRSCFCGAPSLTRGRVCLLYKLLALARAVFLGSESLGTRDHILLSQTRDFHFRRLLRLAGSRWRYSTPPPYGSELNNRSVRSVISYSRTA
jgi:hypothetical protein